MKPYGDFRFQIDAVLTRIGWVILDSFIRCATINFQCHNNNPYNTKGATVYPSRAYEVVVGFVLYNFTVVFYKALFVFWFVFLLTILVSISFQFMFYDNLFLLYSNFLKIICVWYHFHFNCVLWTLYCCLVLPFTGTDNPFWYLQTFLKSWWSI